MLFTLHKFTTGAETSGFLFRLWKDARASSPMSLLSVLGFIDSLEGFFSSSKFSYINESHETRPVCPIKSSFCGLKTGLMSAKLNGLRGFPPPPHMESLIRNPKMTSAWLPFLLWVVIIHVSGAGLQTGEFLLGFCVGIVIKMGRMKMY